MRRIVLYLMVTLFSLTANAYTGVYNLSPDGIEYYVITQSNWASVRGLKDKTLKTVTIPDEITFAGTVCKVKEIRDEAFKETSIEKVTIGSNVTSIGKGAFLRSGLKYISLPDNLLKIGDRAFEQTKLISITLPASVREMGIGICEGCTELRSATMYCPVGKDMFKDCSWLKSITFHIENAIIGGYTFISEVILGPEVKYIRFAGMKNLQGVKIPENVTTIGDHCFYDTAVLSVFVPKTVTKIETGAFYNCKSLQELYIPNSGILYDNSQTNYYVVLGNCPSLMDVYVYMDEWAEGNKYSDKVIDLPDRKTYLHVHPNQLENFKKTEIWTNNFQMILPMTEDELATNIDSVVTNKSIQSSDYYTLSGQRVANPKHGIYIQDGRKVVIK